MNVIHKYPLPQHRDVEIDLPKGAKILSVGVQSKPFRNDATFLWAIVDPNETSYSPTRLCMVPTGKEPPHNYTAFLGTLITDNGDFVLHCFQVPN